MSNKHLLQILLETVAVKTNNLTEIPVSYKWSVKCTFATMFPQWTMSLTQSNRRLPNFRHCPSCSLSPDHHPAAADTIQLMLSQAPFCVGNRLHHRHVHKRTGWSRKQTMSSSKLLSFLPTNHYLGGRPVCRRHPSRQKKSLPYQLMAKINTPAISFTDIKERTQTPDASKQCS